MWDEFVEEEPVRSEADTTVEFTGDHTSENTDAGLRRTANNESRIDQNVDAEPAPDATAKQTSRKNTRSAAKVGPPPVTETKPK